MKLSLIASFLCLSMVACGARQLPPENYGITETVTTKRQLPTPPVKGEVVEVLAMVPDEEVKEETNPQDYAQVSDLIHREVRGKTCVCVSGDPFCRCKVKTLTKMPTEKP